MRRAECVAIVGPTGIGKSALAMNLAPVVNGEIINADAVQVYRDLDLGTSKPSAEDRRRVVHHLLDVVPPTERFSAGEFARRAAVALESLRSRGIVGLVVGGSGLYYRSLFEGLSPIPPVPEEIRLGVRARLESEGVGALYQELSTLDRETARRLSPNDRQRISRALEVLEATGHALSWWQKKKRERVDIAVVRVGLTLPREVLYDRLALRVSSMLQSGWLEEVKELLAAGLDETAPAFQAIGYRELASHLRGERSLEEAVASIVQATRRYAKRQLTWFKNEAGVRWFEAVDEGAADEGTLLSDVLNYLAEEGIRSRV